ncbi:MAG: hypothetical protein UY17_C0034G0011, partial [Candidatus Beckwithbacteria bacterium GW2011_GWC2_47_9]
MLVIIVAKVSTVATNVTGAALRAFLKFLLVISVILGLSIFLAPWLYTFLPYKFERIFNRLIMIFSLAAVLLFVRVRRAALTELGFEWSGKKSAQQIAAGFLCGFLVLLLFLGIKVALKQAVWAPDAESLVAFGLQVGGAFFAAFLIGVIEEFFFRGFVFKTCLGQWRWPLLLSLLATNVFYSLIHFVAFYKPFVDPTPGWIDSLRLAGAPFIALGGIGQFWPEALGLLIFGMILSRIVLTARSLFPAIG